MTFANGCSGTCPQGPVAHWRFTPTLVAGVPVPVIMTVTVNFTLN